MKKIIILLAMAVAAVSCSNEKFEYQDFDVHTVYFPWQYPVRTLSLGNDALDNSMDKQGKFSVGVSLGGVWKENKKDYDVEVVLNKDLVPDNLYNSQDQRIEVLPDDYYTLSDLSHIRIPKGDLTGRITVQLNDKFFQDPKSLQSVYVLPLQIVNTSADSILVGKVASGVDNPDRHDKSHYESNKTPKDFTLFAVKYVNAYHGKFLRRYATETHKTDGKVLVENFRATDPERNQVVGLTSQSLTEVMTDFAAGDNAKGKMLLNVDPETNAVTVSAVAESTIQVEGTGEWVVNGDAWGMDQNGQPKKRDVFRLQYNYTNDLGEKVVVRDTIVFRDRQIKFEELAPQYK